MRPSSSAFSQPSKTVTVSIAVNLSFSSRARYLSKRYEASAQPSAAARERSASPAFGIVTESSAHPREAAARAAEKAATRTRSGVSLSSGPSPAMTAQRTVLSATGTTSSLPASPRKFSLTTTRRQKSRISPRSGSSETVSGSPSAASMAITASDSALKFSSWILMCIYISSRNELRVFIQRYDNTFAAPLHDILTEPRAVFYENFNSAPFRLFCTRGTRRRFNV